MSDIHINIKNEKKIRKKFTDDYILGHYCAFAKMKRQLSLIKGAFDLEVYQARVKLGKKVK